MMMLVVAIVGGGLCWIGLHEAESPDWPYQLLASLAVTQPRAADTAAAGSASITITISDAITTSIPNTIAIKADRTWRGDGVVCARKRQMSDVCTQVCHTEVHSGACTPVL